MTEEIVIFDRTIHAKSLDRADAPLLNAMDQAAAAVLRIAASKKDANQVRRSLGHGRVVVSEENVQPYVSSLAL